jgi:CheY-like chemotaxis protein
MKILIIDDHAVVRAGISRLLVSELGVLIFEAESGQDAMDIWQREKPNLIVLDSA